MAEREGFEPSIRFCRILTFQASAFDHSATAPHALEGGSLSCGAALGKGMVELPSRQDPRLHLAAPVIPFRQTISDKDIVPAASAIPEQSLSARRYNFCGPYARRDGKADHDRRHGKGDQESRISGRLDA